MYRYDAEWQREFDNDDYFYSYSQSEFESVKIWRMNVCKVNNTNPIGTNSSTAIERY